MARVNTKAHMDVPGLCPRLKLCWCLWAALMSVGCVDVCGLRCQHTSEHIDACAAEDHVVVYGPAADCDHVHLCSCPVFTEGYMYVCGLYCHQMPL